MTGRGDRPAGVFWRPNPEFVAELAGYLKGKRVLEVFAGNGYLASQLQAEGVDVRATSLRMGHDCHDQGFHCEVEDKEASHAIREYGASCDVLVMCWPTVTEKALQALILWGFDKPVIYIGETPRPELGMSGLSGCATDAFFELIRWELEFTAYRGNMLEKAGVVHLDLPKFQRFYSGKKSH